MLAGEPGLQFHFCSDPTKAIEKANAVQPTVILQDLVMPDVDGLTLVKFYRANPATGGEVPLIVLSTKEEPETKAQAFATGANDYLVKLPDKVELIASSLPFPGLRRPAGAERGLPQAGREPSGAGPRGG